MLVNEAAEIDVDGGLLDAAHRNAAAGVATGAADSGLAGGCACCDVSDALREALTTVRGDANGAADCLVRWGWDGGGHWTAIRKPFESTTYGAAPSRVSLSRRCRGTAYSLMTRQGRLSWPFDKR